MAKQINIREELNKRDAAAYNTDFVNMYESANLSKDKKKKLAEMLAKNVSNKNLTKFFTEEVGKDNYTLFVLWADDVGSVNYIEEESMYSLEDLIEHAKTFIVPEIDGGNVLHAYITDIKGEITWDSNLDLVEESVEGDQMVQDRIDSKNANFEADKEATREVRKELAKQGIATDETGKPFSESYDREFTIEINGEIYEDENGDAYHFDTYEDAQEFIEENELENAEIIRQHGKAKYESFVKGPRGEFKLSDKSAEELKKDGYGFHHKFEKDGKKYQVLTKDNQSIATLDEAISSNGLEQQIKDTIRDVFKDYEMDDYDAVIGDYIVVDIVPQDGRTKIEVRAELSYRSMEKIADALDPIVQKIDKDAYFDHEDFGIISAYVSGNKLTESHFTNDPSDENVYQVIIYYKDTNKRETCHDKLTYEESCELFDSIKLTPEIEKVVRLNDYETEEVKSNTLKESEAYLDEYDEETAICQWCDCEYPISELRNEIDLGYLCPTCISAIKSRGEKLKFEENLKEEYGYYKDEPYCEEIADDLENGIWVGETSNGTSWELTINGYSSNEFSPSFADYLAEEVAYPVRDGHLAYIGIEMILYKSSMESIFGYDSLDRLIPDLIKLGLDRKTINKWLKDPDPDAELDFHYDFDIAFDTDEWEEKNKEDIDLPSDVYISINDLGFDHNDPDASDELDDMIGDYLSNTYGYCHYGFNYDVNGDEIYVYDIDWDLSESLKEDVSDYKNTNTNKEPLKPATFVIEDGQPFEGYDEEYYWNGWECPWFTKEVGDAIAEYYKEFMHFNSNEDTYVYDCADGSLDYFVGEDINTVDGVKHLYPIGNKSWIWSKYSEPVDESLTESSTDRTCSECGNAMCQGYVVDDGLEYFCSDECLHKHYSEEEVSRMFDNAKVGDVNNSEYDLNHGQIYWTEFDCDEYDKRAVEQEYGLEDGELDAFDIREAEKMIGCEEGELDRFIFSDGLEEDYTHFTYKSGANPYIAKTDKEAQRILNKYKGKVKETKKGFYEIDDTKEGSFITESADTLLSNEEFVNACVEQGIEGSDIILDWDKKQHTFEEWKKLLLDTYLDLEQDLLAMGEYDIVKSNRETVINKLVNKKFLSESRPTSKDYGGIEKAVNSAIYSKEGQLDKLLNKVIVEMENLYGPWEWQPGAPNTEEEYRRSIRDQFSQIEYVDEFISEWKGIKEGRTLVDLLTQIRDILDNDLPPKPNYLGDE